MSIIIQCVLLYLCKCVIVLQTEVPRVCTAVVLRHTSATESTSPLETKAGQF